MTWSRSNLKSRAKDALHRNYWKLVLAAFIVTLVTGVAGGGSTGRLQQSTREIQESIKEETTTTIMTEKNNLMEEIQEFTETIDDSTAVAMGVIGIALLIVILIVILVSVAIKVFLINPFKVGVKRFFNRSLVEDAPLRDLVYGYEHNYLNSVKIIFLKDLYTSLWSLLFVIPGIVKGYEYRMVPYILSDNPEMSSKEVFARSRELMHGQKWAAFVLDLSFIGWLLLAGITCGLVGIFWVNPYRMLTDAALYRELSGADHYEYQNPQGNTYDQNNYYTQQDQNSPYGQGYYNQNDFNSQTDIDTQSNGYDQ